MIEQFIQHLEKKEASSNTIKNYKRDLQLFDKYVADKGYSMSNLNEVLVQQYVNELNKKYAATTTNRMFAAISSYCHFTKQSEAVYDISKIKTKHISKQEAKGLEEAEWQSIRLSIANNKSNPNRERDLALFDFLLFSGVRISELVALNKDNITFKKGVYTIHITDSKNKSERYVYMDSKQYKYIKRYLDQRTDDCEALFISSRNKRISIRTVQHMLNKYEIHPHELRHTFCSTLTRNNVDLVTVASLAGHTDINTTRRYSNPTAKEMAEAVSRVFNS
ncbi:tyrosine-type recombinase/integrase [Jeotgalibacillus malaysiensis]|uniref:tyrosine-type recombinase/integrase n=1 Tax=Jeotgalibacillus malaysiensis TaxID=1508404 RepID=UPI00384B6F21